MALQDDLLELEEHFVDEANGQWKAGVERLKKDVLLLLSTVQPGETVAAVALINAMLNRLTVPDIDRKGMDAVLAAHTFGLSTIKVSLRDPDLELPNVAVSNNSRRAVTGLNQKATEALNEARNRLSMSWVAENTEDLLFALAPLLQNPARTEAALSWAINNAANSAVSKAALKMNETMVWISERDGCLACTAYAGLRSTLTGFPKGLSYGKKPKDSEGTLPHPPLHPRCRCVVEVGISTEYAEALKREAVRSVLRGFKLPSESEKARIEAAKELLNKNPQAPESVKKYAERAVKKGSFNGKKSS